MPLLQDFELMVDVDQVLRAQGADPVIIRKRSQRLVDIAQHALEEGLPLLEPKVLFQEFGTKDIRHEQLSLEGGGKLKGKLIAQHLAPARRVVVILCTIGETLEVQSSELSATNIVDGLALEGVGSAAVEVLANMICNQFEYQAMENGYQTTIPLSPGMIDWPVDQGQPQIFKLLDVDQVGVKLTPSYVMVPRKSLTMVIGIGENVLSKGSTCDYCNMRETCQYKDHYSAD